MATLEAIKYHRGSLQILNQLLLPFESVYEAVHGVNDGFNAIKTMKVRGAPAIAIVAALSLAVEISTHPVAAFSSAGAVSEFIKAKLEHLKQSRPTAVNLFEAADRLEKIVSTKASVASTTPADVVATYLHAAEAMLAQDIQDNKNIGKFGAEFITKGNTAGKPIRLLTHCNTGSLATAGWGTALGIIRDLHHTHKLDHVYCTETRPYNQGGRLTAYELVYEKINATLITDSMASALLRDKSITAIVVGADRVAANGDTANKIGTYQLAITAAYHGVMFIVAAPSTSIDLSTPSGDKIKIEERPGIEVVQMRGELVDDEGNLKEHQGDGGVVTTTVHIAAKGINVWNPSFDVAPAKLISAIVTEKGVITKAEGSDVFDVASFLKSH
ncbi:S-methyl-5-thioribose-1-phosphate isomerase [Blyttiomyces sp. JEL0837]|nr:S-methyl-5-thioribose-1-phosphate isomerase [Blyttiomyces sp. JEL0837]